MRGNQYSFRCCGRILRNSTETFQICTILSEMPQSPRDNSSEIMAKVCTSVFGSTGVPPNSSGMPSVRMPILCACSRIPGGRRFSGLMSHSRCQFLRMKGVTKSLTKARQASRIMICSSDRPRSLVIIGVFLLGRFFVCRYVMPRFEIILAELAAGVIHAEDRQTGVRRPTLATQKV